MPGPIVWGDERVPAHLVLMLYLLVTIVTLSAVACRYAYGCVSDT